MCDAKRLQHVGVGASLQDQFVYVKLEDTSYARLTSQALLTLGMQVTKIEISNVHSRVTRRSGRIIEVPWLYA